MQITKSITRPWNYFSGVFDCGECEGHGYISRGGMGGNDPSSYSLTCQDCSGVGHHACTVCGFDVPVAGYDCIVCETAYNLTPAQMSDINPADIADAFAQAFNAALNAGRAA